MFLRPIAAVAIALLCATTSAADLRLAVDASTEMPWAHIQNDELRSGIHLDLGRALAARMGREPVFLVLPRQRLSRALENGEADIACVFQPEWLPGPFDWTQRFVEDADLVLTLRSSPAPRRVQDLAGVRLGTVNGFRYPDIERALGERFVRDDAPNATNNLRKLDYGRITHAVTNERFLQYQRRQGLLHADVHPPLVIARYRSGCAVSRRGHATLTEVSAAIAQLQHSGALGRLLANYR